MRGKRRITGGRTRATLYMATLAAIRRNPKFQATYQRLVQPGKPKRRAHRLHAKTPHRAECDPENKNAVAADLATTA